MPHLAVLGSSPSPVKRCDPRRTSIDIAGGVTVAMDLLAGRYLHTTRAGQVGNQSRTPLNATPGRGSAQVSLEPRSFVYRSGWLAGDLSVAGIAATTARRHDGIPGIESCRTTSKQYGSPCAQ
jgi:hypothetical protein